MKRSQILASVLVVAFGAIAGSAVHGAEQAKTNGAAPFKLKAQKTHLPGISESGPTTRLRLIRPQLNDGAAQDSMRLKILHGADTRHSLKADDWLLPEQARSDLLQGALAVKALSDFDLEIIVDQSLSMRRRDCPDHRSRWNWCGSQLTDLSTQLSPYVPNGFTLTTFNSEFQTFQNALPRHINALFASPAFAGGTRLSRPLRARLNQYFSQRTPGSKPLLLVVITDGVPFPFREPDLVADTLIAASRRVNNPREITIIFFQIGGGDRVGRYFLNQLDNSLVRHGARYDLVQTVPFEDLEHYGLTQSLVSCVRNFAGQRSGKY